MTDTRKLNRALARARTEAEGELATLAGVYEKALAAVPDSVEVKGDPVWCPLPGTNMFQLQAPIPLEGDVDLGNWPEQSYRFKSRVQLPRMRHQNAGGQRP